MNRPFYAFSVLMAFLVLAMLAVALTSRPTRQQPNATGGSGLEAPRRAPGGPIFVQVFAAPELDLVPTPVAVTVATTGCPALPSYQAGCGLDRTTGLVYTVGGEILRRRPAKTASSLAGMQPAAIRVAADVQALGESANASGQSHYDAAYDVAMGWIAAAEIPAIEISHPTSGPAKLATSDEILALFQSLQTAASGAPAPAAGASHWRWRFYPTASLINGVVNEAWQQLAAAKLDDDWQRAAARAGTDRQAPAQAARPDWSDYQDWITSQQPGVSERSTQTGEKAALSPQMDRPLVQIAVAGLNHVAEMLHASADWLELDSTDRLARQPGSAVGAIARPE
ncbi:MAG: hypothetical protein WD872_02190 [Pirellulaceae bacterium]